MGVTVSRFRSQWLILPGLALLLLTTLYLAREPLLLAIGDFLVVQDTLQPADLIAVVSGDPKRVEYGIDLYRQGYAPALFFTGGWSNTYQMSHAEHKRQLALDRGIANQAIHTDSYPIKSTYSEAERLKYFLDHREPQTKTVIVVSSPLHMRRVRWAYRRVLGDRVRLIVAHPPLDDTERNWWTNEQATKMVREEYLKLVYYYARYQYSWGPMREWLVSLDKG